MPGGAATTAGIAVIAGMAVIVNPYFADSIQRQLAPHRLRSWIIGEVQEGERGVEW